MGTQTMCILFLCHKIKKGGNMMTTLERLKLELANKQYFTDTEYTTLLSENSLSATDPYNKETMQRNLLLTVLDVLTMLTNDIDLFRKLQDDATGFTQDSAYELLAQRIKALKERIEGIALPQEELSDIHLIFTRRR